MKKLAILFISLFLGSFLFGQTDLGSDVLETEGGEIEMFFIGHGTLMFKYNNMIIHIDPVSREYNYSKLPDADLILVTHEHGDHLDASAINEIVKDGTKVIMTQQCVDNLEDSYNAIVMANGDQQEIMGMVIEAYPAYNIQHKRGTGSPYHPKGKGNAYMLTLGDKNILIGGDTENVPELKKLKYIDVAFLPMNLPYTMTPEMVADLALAMKPKILYPYHFGRTDTEELVELLRDHPEIEVRIRELE